MGVFNTLCVNNWPVTLDTFGVTGTLTDSDGTEYACTGVFTPRIDSDALDTSWLERVTQVEFYCVLPTGFVVTPGECYATVDGVTYTIMDAGISDGNNTKLLLERSELEAVEHRGRRL